MIITPRVRGPVCLAAHPEGCARHVQDEIDHVLDRGCAGRGPRNVLVIGGSTGYGLSTRIVATFGYRAQTFGVHLERAPETDKPASAGWYNNAAFERKARACGSYACSVNGDAFAADVKDAVLERVAADLGPVDLVVYSLAAPRRLHPVTGHVHRSVIKPIGRTFTNKSVDADRGTVEQMTLDPASPAEITDTVAVMGGEDWGLWIDRLAEAGLLAAGAITCAYSYLGPELTWPIYREGTIGRAKQDLEAQAARLDERLRALDGRAFVSVNKAVVTQASAAIPVVSLYLALLFAVMKEKGLHEDCVQQICRLFGERLYGRGLVPVDDCGRIRLDELELRGDVQDEVMRRWQRLESDNLGAVVDLAEYRNAFLRLFGFGYPDIDYAADADCLCGWAV